MYPTDSEHLLVPLTSIVRIALGWTNNLERDHDVTDFHELLSCMPDLLLERTGRGLIYTLYSNEIPYKGAYFLCPRE